MVAPASWWHTTFMNPPSDASGYVSPFSSHTVNLNLAVGTGSNLLPIVFFIIFAIWMLYTLVAAYHWFRYGHKSWLAVPAIALHVFVSGLLIIYIASGLA